jgi:hypothetical protein
MSTQASPSTATEPPESPATGTAETPPSAMFVWITRLSARPGDVGQMLEEPHLREVISILQGQDREDMRAWNKGFFTALIAIFGTKSKATIWLKKNIDSDTCKKIFRDFKYSGTTVSTARQSQACI